LLSLFKMRAKSPQSVHISTPSRLHFGLLRFEQCDGYSYGGLGMMIDRPRVELEITPATSWSAEGPAASRARAYAEPLLAYLSNPDKPSALHIRVHGSIPLHRGLGGGTQLALAVAAGVFQMERRSPGIAQLAAAVDRGRRSAVGSYGFTHGGLIWEKGRLPEDKLAPLAARVAVPDAWRVVLISPRHARGRSGAGEQQAFAALPPVPAVTSQRLTTLAEEQILPAARRADLADFGAGVYEYGRVAGECFATVQGGPYATREIAQCVDAIRACGVRGVGQSSWGPTVFAIVATADEAADLSLWLAENPPYEAAEVEITAPDNRGAVIDVKSEAAAPNT
jgi:beta-RFAP synthase